MNINFDWSKIMDNAKKKEDEDKLSANTVVDIQHTLNNALSSRQPQNPGAPVNTVTTQTSGFGRTN